MWREQMIRLKDIILENKENRIGLMKLTAIMEKLVPELTKAQQTRLTELCTEAYILIEELNQFPCTIFNYPQWQVLKFGVVAKLTEVKLEAEKLMESDKVNVVPFIKALDEIIVN